MDMDYLIVLLYGVIVAICSLIGSFLTGIVYHYGFERRLNALERGLDTLEGRITGAVGVNRKAEKQERMNQAMAEAALLFQEKKTPQEIAQILLPKYPDIALEIIKKGGIL